MSKHNGWNRRDFLKAGALSTLGLGAVSCTPTTQRGTTSAFGDAKNVIFLVSDGMSSGTLALAELVKKMQYGESTHWMQLYESDRPFHRGLMDMASLNSPVTGSGAASSSWGSGNRVNNNTINQSPGGTPYKTICEIFRDAGKAAGLVTTTRITHATPAGFSASVPHRNMEQDIALQYYEREYDVLLGGGMRNFEASSRDDGLDLAGAFQAKGYTLATTRQELAQAPAQGKLLGLFHPSHLPYTLDHLAETEWERDIPPLAEMSRAALDRLDRHNDGFILQIEGGRVDYAAHDNDAAALVYDQIAFDDAVKVVLDFTAGRDDTLVLLTTDHGNANPGLLGLGSGYNDTNHMLATLPEYRRSYEWIYDHLGWHWSLDAIEGVTTNQVRELLEYASNTPVTAEQATYIRDAFLGAYQAPFFDRQTPGAVMSAVLANHNGIYFVGTNHTADFVELASWGPGSDRIPARVRNTDLFDLMVDMAGVRDFAS